MRHGPSSHQTAKSSPPRILIVEDNVSIAYFIDNMVSGIGYGVSGLPHTIVSARQELAKRNFDAVLLDLDLGGQNSSEIADLLQEMGMPFALVSGYDRVFDVRYKNVPLLHKPFTPYQLSVLLERLVGLAGRTPQCPMSSLQNCWEIMNCGRHKGGPKEDELGECIASREGMGHSCWAIAGTMCGGVVTGTAAQKQATCMSCQVYKFYNRLSGAKAADVRTAFPEEEVKYTERLLASRAAATGWNTRRSDRAIGTSPISSRAC